MKTYAIVLSTLAASVVVGVAGAYAFVLSGIFDVSATTPDSPLVYWATHQTMEHSIARRLGANTVPAGLDAAHMIAEGGQLYVENCVVCHGRPDLATTAISKGLNPIPADLFRPDRHPDPAENFQFIKYGLKMTAMPGFGPTHSDDQVWALAAFLNILPGITAADFAKALGPSPNGG
jgi:mono/diheme cytochrome c family protein